MGTRRELIAAVAKRFQAAGRREKGRITSTTTLKHAVLIAGATACLAPFWITRWEMVTAPSCGPASKSVAYSNRARPITIALWQFLPPYRAPEDLQNGGLQHGNLEATNGRAMLHAGFTLG